MLRNTAVFGWPEGADFPFFLFRVKNNKKKTATQIVIDDNCLGRIIDLLDDEPKGGWIQSAASYYYAKEERRLIEKYKNLDCSGNSDGLSDSFEAMYKKEIMQKEIRYRDRSWITNSCEPLGVAEFSTDLYPSTCDTQGKAGATMTIYYQPYTRPKERARKPWRVEIRQYQLCLTLDGSIERKNERKNHVNLSSEEFNNVVNQLVLESGLYYKVGLA